MNICGYFCFGGWFFDNCLGAEFEDAFFPLFDEY
jgi:hypothetical protein